MLTHGGASSDHGSDARRCGICMAGQPGLPGRPRDASIIAPGGVRGRGGRRGGQQLRRCAAGQDRRIGTGGPVLDGVYYYVMARPAKFSGEDFLDTAVRLVAGRGPGAATMAAISSELGAPTGSLYHRFESRDLLLAQAWVRTVREAQTGFVAALGHDDVEQAGFDAALHIPRWCRAHLDGARVLLLYRREDLVERWPEELGAELATLNDSVDDALGSYTARRFGHSRADARRSVVFALVDVPSGPGHR